MICGWVHVYRLSSPHFTARYVDIPVNFAQAKILCPNVQASFTADCPECGANLQVRLDLSTAGVPVS